LEITIEKMIYGGDGLGRLPADEQGRGKAVFVPFVLPGERVDATLIEQKAGFARGRADRMLQTSPERIEPGCRYFLRCGGCHYQHTGYEQQLAIKAAILRENLRRLAKVELEGELQIHASPQWSYRNRSRFRVRSQGTFAAGYFKFNSHELLSVEECPISSPLINRALAALWQFGRSGNVPEQLREIEFFADAEDTNLLLELYVATAQRGSHAGGAMPGVAKPGDRSQRETHDAAAELALRPAQDFVAAWQASMPETLSAAIFAQVPSHASGTEPQTGEEPLWSSNPEGLTYRTRTTKYRVSPGSFFQVNRHMVDELTDVVTGAQRGAAALDLYAGGGLFSTALSERFDHIVAVESSQSSFADLRYNAPANVKPVRTGVEQYLAKEGNDRHRPDLVIVDPPRGGLGDRVVQGVLKLAPPRLTYVSCDPATLARDLRPLLTGGYKLEQAHLLDLFPQTFHMETVLQLAK
jgi:23S rRNA (uracil1939-C5)-methyltransferase